MLRFQYSEFFSLLGLLPLVAALFFYAVYRRRKTAKILAEKHLLGSILKNYNPAIYTTKFILVFVALGLLAIAAVNPRSRIGSQQVKRNGIDVMVVLDVSKSMLAKDLQPTRLERAKQLVYRLVEKLKNDRIGIVVFAGKAYLQMPLTGDHTAAKMYISSADPSEIPTQGTAIGAALRMAASSFNTEEKKYKAVLLISDGEDHDEGAEKIARQLGEQGVVIYTVGMGSPQGSVIPDEITGENKTDREGNVVISKLNEDELRMIASAGNGKYILFQNADAVTDVVVSDFSGMDQREVTDDSLTNYESFAFYFLGAALLLMTIEFFLGYRRRKPVSAKALMVLVFACSAGMASAQTEKQLVKQGNEAYAQKDYAAAADNYEKALKLKSDMPEASFNKGNAKYKAGKKDDAIAAYDEAIRLLENPIEKSNAWYNKGVVLQNNQKIPECIEAYKQALKLDPKNEDARQNLQKALQQQKQQQQKEKEKQDQKQKNNQQKEKEQDPKPQPSRLKKQDAIDKLKALEQQEKNLQEKMHKANTSPSSRPEKDW